VVCLVFYFQIGGTFSFNFSNLSLSDWSWEEILITITLLDYLLGTIQAVRADGNAMKGLLRLPILRHWHDYQNTRRGKGK
jgi:hypothetical protein